MVYPGCPGQQSRAGVLQFAAVRTSVSTLFLFVIAAMKLIILEAEVALAGREAFGNCTRVSNRESKKVAEATILRSHRGHSLEVAQRPRLTFQRGEKSVSPVLDVVV